MEFQLVEAISISVCIFLIWVSLKYIAAGPPKSLAPLLTRNAVYLILKSSSERTAKAKKNNTSNMAL